MHNRVMSNSYFRAVGRADVTAQNAPGPVVESAKRLVAAIETRGQANSDWIAAKDAYTSAKESRIDDIARGRIRGKETQLASFDELEKRMDEAALERDVTAKVAAEMERDHADVVAEHVDEWRETLDAEAEKLTAEVAVHVDAIEAACDRLDVLRNTRHVATETQPRKLQRLKNARHTGQPRDGVRLLRKWLAPPAPKQTPVVSRNFGPLSGANVIQLGQGELGREEAR
jgi:hypothetical protein